MRQIFLTPIVKRLLIVNVAIFFLISILIELSPALATVLYKNMALQSANVFTFSETGWGDFRPVQLVGWFFLHVEPFHLLFNVMALVSLGPAIEQRMGTKRFLFFYLFCGVIGGAMVAFLNPMNHSTIGASGAIFGIMAAFAMYYPHTPLSFFFLPAVPARRLMGYTIAVSFGLFLLQLTGRDLGWFGQISHFGHLTGIAAAVIYFYIEDYIPIKFD